LLFRRLGLLAQAQVVPQPNVRRGRLSWPHIASEGFATKRDMRHSGRLRTGPAHRSGMLPCIVLAVALLLVLALVLVQP
jgi:hypothetical protein